MNLQTEIKTELWNAISKSYEAGSYRNAVLDAIHYLSDILREKANVDGDGSSLVGQALGGDNPRLRINKFQTESEKNEQKGVEQIIRGIYQGIRNPRSHEQYQDKQEAANAIILFVDYILGIVNQARVPFVLDEWSKRVFDPDFVPSDRYATLLFSEVPAKKYGDALITVYRQKMSGDINKIKYVFKPLINSLDIIQEAEFLSIVSDELKTVSKDQVIKAVFQILPAKLWEKIDEVARIRVENKIIQSIKLGKTSDPENDSSDEGWLATWAASFLQYFTLKAELASALAEKLKGDEAHQNYVAKYFLWTLPDTTPAGSTWWGEMQRDRYINIIVEKVSDPWGSEYLRRQLISFYDQYPEEWRELIKDKLKPLEESDPEFYKKLTTPPEDDFPF